MFSRRASQLKAFLSVVFLLYLNLHNCGNSRGYHRPVCNSPRKRFTPYLVKYVWLRYSRAAVVSPTVGCRNPGNLLAAPHLACAVALTHLLQMRLLYCVSKISMVTQAGQPSGWSVTSRTDIPTPVWVTTQECRNSGGSVIRNLLEPAKWLRPSPQFTSLSAPAAYSPGHIMNDSAIYETLSDSWSICDSCRILANALINPQNTHSQIYLSLMMQTQLESLETALAQPVPDNHETFTQPTDDGLFDNTELEPAELCDQCRALNYALIMLSNSAVKEVLAFVLCERLEMLRNVLYSQNEAGQ